ncbi:MAG TPA: hypothetical protein VGJ82_21685 [Thermoanaerobaculia bacterium]|jgi:hypothetical protein
MRRVSKRVLRLGAAVVLVSLVGANAAFATPVDRDGGWQARFPRLTRLIVTTLDLLGIPPG